MAETENQFVAAVEERIAKFGDAPELSAQGRPVKALRRAQAVAVHPAKVPQALDVIDGFTQSAIDALQRCDYQELGRAIDRFGRDFWYGGFTQAPIEKSQKESWTPTFLAWGWDGQDLDAGFAYVRQGEKIESVSWDHFVIAGRRIDREKARLGLKPRWSSMTDAEWLAQFRPMRRGRIDIGGIVLEGAHTASERDRR